RSARGAAIPATRPSGCRSRTPTATTTRRCGRTTWPAPSRATAATSSTARPASASPSWGEERGSGPGGSGRGGALEVLQRGQALVLVIDDAGHRAAAARTGLLVGADEGAARWRRAAAAEGALGQQEPHI